MRESKYLTSATRNLITIIVTPVDVAVVAIIGVADADSKAEGGKTSMAKGMAATAGAVVDAGTIGIMETMATVIATMEIGTIQVNQANADRNDQMHFNSSRTNSSRFNPRITTKMLDVLIRSAVAAISRTNSSRGIIMATEVTRLAMPLAGVCT